jgi:hypothetical protein
VLRIAELRVLSGAPAHLFHQSPTVPIVGYAPSGSHLSLLLPPLYDDESLVHFQSVRLLRAVPLSDSCSAELVTRASTADDLSLEALSDELNTIIELSTGTAAWKVAPPRLTDHHRAPASASPGQHGWGHGELVGGPLIGGWLGAPGWNPLLGSDTQAEQPLLGCAEGVQEFSLQFALTAVQAACGVISLAFSTLNADLTNATINEHTLASRDVAPNSGVFVLAAEPHEILASGGNVLRIFMQPRVAGLGCGVALQSEVARFVVHAATPRLPNTQAALELEFAPLPSGAVVVAMSAATNRAGMVTAVSLGAVMLDGTRPTHASLRGCTPGGRQDESGTFYQSSIGGLTVCWPLNDFVDEESGLWRLQWQLAGWVEGVGWDVLMETQSLPEARSMAALMSSSLHLSAEELHGVLGRATPSHRGRYRLGVRVLNRAGLHSCGADACLEGERWVLVEGAIMEVDTEPPTCAHANAWLCDPLIATDGRACHNIALSGLSKVGSAGSGYQASI